jgi:hypothetical protein
MPLDVPGCTRATMIIAVSILPSSCAQLLCSLFNFLVRVCVTVVFAMVVYMRVLDLVAQTDAFFYD